jgi:hypothetical protein
LLKTCWHFECSLYIASQFTLIFLVRLTVKKHFLFVVSAVALSVSANIALADAPYFVELGSPDTAENAKTRWDELKESHGASLKGLNYYPKAVVRDDGSTATTIQAGPISDKGKAQRLCKRLFAKDVSCFVIEGAEEAPPSQSKSMSHLGVTQQPIAAVTPVISAPVTAAPAQPQMLGQMSEPKVAKEANVVAAPAKPVVLQAPKPLPIEGEDAVVAKNEAKVAVAEAIPVPLSGGAEATSAPAKTLPVLSAPRAAAPVVANELAPVEFAVGEAGWLTVESFKDDKLASDFWASVRSRSPEATAGLRVRLLRPLYTRSGVSVKLNIGPFPDTTSAKRFCIDVIRSANSELTCSFQRSDTVIKADDTQVESVPVAAPVTQASRYEQRRRVMRAQYAQETDAPQQSTVGTLGTLTVAAPVAVAVPVATHQVSGKSFWAQVVTGADSRNEANQQLSAIKNANADLFGEIPSRVTSSPMKRTKFNVRLGPFDAKQTADDLCSNLQNRSVDCLVITTRD